MRVAPDDERDEEELLERNERKRHVVADSIASFEFTLHAADAEHTWQHERLVYWLMFLLRAFDVLDTPLYTVPPSHHLLERVALVTRRQDYSRLSLRGRKTLMRR